MDEKTYKEKRQSMRKQFDRSASFGDYFTDRWERAQFEGFGEGTSCYDNVLILGDVKIGNHVWIGPGVILDGSGGLTIGDHCAISAGVHIYTHSTVRKNLSMGELPIERKPTRIGSGVYIGPQSVIEMGVTVGDQVVIGAMSFVNRDVQSLTRVHGCPAKVVGQVDPHNL